MWLKKLRRLIRLFFFQLTGKKGDKVAKLTKPVIAVNIDGTVRVLNQDPNATHFNWYTRELLSYNITSPNYDTVVAGTNESTTALPNSSYTNRVYITESYRDIRKFTSFTLYEAGSSAVDVTELYVTKISDFEYSISIPNVEHDYIITWGVGAVTYTITSSLTNCVADKSDESYVGGTAVNIVITAATGYTFDSSLGGTIGLSVGEVDKTSEYMTRSSDNKKVTIAIPAIAAVGNIIYAAGAVIAGASASITPKPNVVYADGISDLDANTISSFAKAISNTSDITNSTKTIYVDYGELHRRINVGDTVNVTGVSGENKFDIIGFNHDDLTVNTSYGEITATGKAGITFQLHSVTTNEYYMTTKETNVDGWGNCKMRTVTLVNIKNTFSSEWQNIIKTVNKLTHLYRSNIETTNDNLFLPSEIEIFGYTTYSGTDEGTQYKYYIDGGSKIKDSYGTKGLWWTRSPRKDNAYYYCSVGSNGKPEAFGTTYDLQISYIFCV